MITAVVYSVLGDRAGGSPKSQFSDISAHMCNSVFMALDLHFCDVPILFKHYVWQFGYLFSWVIWSLIHWFARLGSPSGKRYLYTITDYSKPWACVMWICILIVVVTGFYTLIA